MKAITVVPGLADQVRVSNAAPADGGLRVEGLLLGLCGTDADIVLLHEGVRLGAPGQDRLLIGHESLAPVLEAPEGAASRRETCRSHRAATRPVPRSPCSQGEWDFCRNGRYTEARNQGAGRVGSQRWRVEPEYAIKLDPA